MTGLARFTVSTPSRHPAGLKGYDPGKSRYRDDYVNPPGWDLVLGFFPRGSHPDSILRVAASFVSYEWLIDEVDGPFSTHVRRSAAQYIPTQHVRVPRPGEYNITLRVTRHDGGREEATRIFRLRDFLVVAIGDSFASGQGNPDVPAVPGPDQRLACRTTSVLIVAQRAALLLADLQRALENGVVEAARAIPLVGELAAAGVTRVEDALDVVGDLATDLRKAVVNVARDVGSGIVEGAEEIGSWLGIGDGGEPDEVDTHPAAWQEPLAYRSYRAGFSLAAAEIERENAFAADRVTFLNLGRSGAEIVDGLLGPRTAVDALDRPIPIDAWISNQGQVAEASATVRGRQIDALLISVGINDVGFSSLVQRSILKASGEKRRQRIAGARNRVLTRYPAELDLLKQAIDRDLRPRHVFVTEYPVGIFQEIADGAEPCGILGSDIPSPASGTGLDLDRADARDLTEVGRLLNRVIRDKTEEFGWTLIDGIERAFDGHGYCARTPYFVSAEESCLRQGDFEGMLHPNAEGHAVVRDLVAPAVRHRMLEADWLVPVLHAINDR
jgi:hypothetical protein